MSDDDDYPFACEWQTNYSRIVKAPNGIEYLVTLEGWYWNSLDWMITEDGWTLDSFTGSAWRVARKMEEAGTMNFPGDFKSEFQEALGMAIQEQMHVTLARIDGHENDNKQPE